MSEWKQIRVRLPADVFMAFSGTDSGTLNGQIVSSLRNYLAHRSTIEQIAREAALARGFSACFSAAEMITRKTCDDDPATLKLALSMIRTLIEKIDPELKGKASQPLARSAIEALLRLGSLDENLREGFSAGLSVAVT